MKLDKYSIMLGSWVDLNEHLNELTIDELRTLLDFELSGAARKSFIKRIHQRIVRLRNAEERDELLGE